MTEERPFMVYGELLDDAGLQKSHRGPEARRTGTCASTCAWTATRTSRWFAARSRPAPGAGVFDIIFATFQSKGNDS